MNQQEKLRAAKDKILAEPEFGHFVAQFDQVDDYKWAILQEVEGQEVWVLLDLTAKKNFDINEAVDDYVAKLETRAAKNKSKEKKEG